MVNNNGTNASEYISSGGRNKTKKSLRFGVRIFAYTILGVVLVIGFLLFMKNRESQIAKNICNGRDNNVFYQETSKFLYPQSYKALEPIVSKILKTHNYDKDVNCTYTVLYYYISIGDVKNAQVYFSKLQNVYSSKTGFTKSYRSKVSSLEDLKKQMDALSHASDQVKKNEIFTN